MHTKSSILYLLHVIKVNVFLTSESECLNVRCLNVAPSHERLGNEAGAYPGGGGGGGQGTLEPPYFKNDVFPSQ